MNPTLHIELHVKFRALLITFANYGKTWDIHLPPAADIITSDRELVKFSQKGVDLLITLKP